MRKQLKGASATATQNDAGSQAHVPPRRSASNLSSEPCVAPSRPARLGMADSIRRGLEEAVADARSEAKESACRVNVPEISTWTQAAQALTDPVYPAPLPPRRS